MPCDPCRGSSPSAGISSGFWIFLLCTFCSNTSAFAWGAGLVCVHVLFGFDIVLLNVNAFAGACGIWYVCICSYTCLCAIFLVRALSASIRASAFRCPFRGMETRAFGVEWGPLGFCICFWSFVILNTRSFGEFWAFLACMHLLFFFQPRCSLVATRLKNKMLAVGCWTRAVILHARAVLGLGNVSQCVHVYVCMHAYMYFCTCACTSRRGGPAA